jgi:hypothetical protein
MSNYIPIPKSCTSYIEEKKQDIKEANNSMKDAEEKKLLCSMAQRSEIKCDNKVLDYLSNLVEEDHDNQSETIEESKETIEKAKKSIGEALKNFGDFLVPQEPDFILSNKQEQYHEDIFIETSRLFKKSDAIGIYQNKLALLITTLNNASNTMKDKNDENNYSMSKEDLKLCCNAITSFQNVLSRKRKAAMISVETHNQMCRNVHQSIGGPYGLTEGENSAKKIKFAELNYESD